MSKRLGNFVEPDDLMSRYGADVVRLWTASVDFTDDISFSEKAMGQVAEIYRRLRNTVRFLLANLFDFDPGSGSLAPAEMSAIDRWALHRLQEVVRQATAAYGEFEFHRVVHALNAFCAVDLSAFYLDVLKDRLYTLAPQDGARRSAQAAMFELAVTLARLMAPLLPHTAEEIWQHLPASARREKSVHLAGWPEPDPKWLNDDLAARWARFLQIRDEVNKALEAARTTGVVEAPLEASVSVFCGPAQRELLEGMGEDLAALFIVSHVAVGRLEDAPHRPQPTAEGGNGRPVRFRRRVDTPVADEGGVAFVPWVQVEVKKAAGRKCARCWLTRPTVGNNTEHKDLCQHCVEVMTR
jgi:isoleucyl-tRNA synthetase